MDIDNDLFLEWENDSAFIDLPDASSLLSDNDKIGSISQEKNHSRNQVSLKDGNSHRELDDDLDFAIAVSLQFQDEIKEQYSPNGQTSTKFQKSGSEKKSEASKPLSIVDKQWELIDPIPDIHALFIEFDDKFFYGKLKSVEVRWSPRMTLCAGICSYQGRGGLCSIALSVPLLKLRPRRDLVETLLHEMIHAYLFVTHNNKDRDGHGPEFLSHMHRINKATGTRITVYHSFHDEVKLYKQHWWKCNGPCSKRPPFFGYVKRSMNRVPGPNDNWWAAHQSSCGGKFVKIKEPDNFGAKKTSKRKQESDSKNQPSLSDIRKFVKVGSPALSSGSSSKPRMSNIESPTLSSKKSVTPKKDGLVTQSSVETAKKGSFVPFFGTGHKLGDSSAAPQIPSIPSTSVTDLRHEHKRGSHLPASSSVKAVTSPIYSKTAKNLKTPSTGSTKNVQKGHSSISASSSLSDSQKYCQQKITDSFKTCSNSTKEFIRDAEKSVSPHIKVPNDIDRVQQNSDIHVDVIALYCPVCSCLVNEDINSHLDKCLNNQAT